MTRRFGIDTSILVRLVTGDPDAEFERCHQALRAMVEVDDAAIYASNQVIGEAYVALQHHYGISKKDARWGLAQILRSGFVAPLNGRAIIDSLEIEGGAGLLDRLIADDYQRHDCVTLTLDQRMAKLPGARIL